MIDCQRCKFIGCWCAKDWDRLLATWPEFVRFLGMRQGPSDTRGACRADGSESMSDGADFVGPSLKGQREFVYKIIREYGPIIDHDTWDLAKLERENILLSTIHARRRDLVLLGLVGDSGTKGLSPVSTVECTKWGLIDLISEKQRTVNLLNESTATQALNFSLTLDQAVPESGLAAVFAEVGL